MSFLCMNSYSTPAVASQLIYVLDEFGLHPADYNGQCIPSWRGRQPLYMHYVMTRCWDTSRMSHKVSFGSSPVIVVFNTLQ